MAEARPFAAAAAAAVAVAAMAAGAGLADDYDAGELAFAGAVASLAFVAWALAGALLIARPVRDTLALTRPRSGAAATARIVAGQLGYGVLVSVALAASGITEGSSIERMDRAMGAAAPQMVAWLALGVALAPGIGEELLFRGLALGALLDRAGPVRALVVSTLAFAVLHLDPAHALGAGLLGLYLGAARIATGSTLVAIVCHVANNAFAVALSTQRWPLWADRLALVAAAGLALLGAIELARRWPRTGRMADEGRAG